MKSIICEFDRYKVIGFDLDGTLYDEFDFVRQAYRCVADTMAECIHVSSTDIWNKLVVEWLKVGSSGPVFQNVFCFYGIPEPDKSTIKKCISLYREATVALVLPERTKAILNYLKDEGKILYLITDGNSNLQRGKIDALGLGEWFSSIAISGDYGKEHQKPSIYMFNILKKAIPQIGDSIYCGDREVDLHFAKSAGIDFLCLRNMCIAQE